MISNSQNGLRAFKFSGIIQSSKQVKGIEDFIDASIADLLPNPEGYLISPHFHSTHKYTDCFSVSLFRPNSLDTCKSLSIVINPEGTVEIESLGGYSSVEAYIVTGATL